MIELLGQGTFGQVVRCQNCQTGDFVAVKVVKNKPAYHNQAKLEIKILKLVILFFFLIENKLYQFIQYYSTSIYK